VQLSAGGFAVTPGWDTLEKETKDWKELLDTGGWMVAATSPVAPRALSLGGEFCGQSPDGRTKPKERKSTSEGR
jgi:hypothetical protein